MGQDKGSLLPIWRAQDTTVYIVDLPVYFTNGEFVLDGQCLVQILVFGKDKREAGVRLGRDKSICALWPLITETTHLAILSQTWPVKRVSTVQLTEKFCKAPENAIWLGQLLLQETTKDRALVGFK